MKCEYCNNEYTDKTLTNCPACGAPLKKGDPVMKLGIVICAVILIFAAGTYVIPTISSDGSMSVSSDSMEGQLKKQLKNAIARNEYGTAVKICENNSAIIEGNSYFDDEVNEIINHFSASAKTYYKCAATYCTKMEVAGYDLKSGFEGYDTSSKTLDPKVLKDLLPAEDYVAAGRTTIKVIADEQGFFKDFEITIDICGRTCSYPSNEDLI